MEFKFDVETLLQPNQYGIAVLDGKTSGAAFRIHEFMQVNTFLPRAAASMTPAEQVMEIVDRMGGGSAKSQLLPSVITTSGRFFGTDNKLYIKVQGNRAIGMLKTGPRKLYVTDPGAKMV